MALTLIALGKLIQVAHKWSHQLTDFIWENQVSYSQYGHGIPYVPLLICKFDKGAIASCSHIEDYHRLSR